MNLYYVAISRARQEAPVYTDSIKRLPSAIARRFDKSTAPAIQSEREFRRRDAGIQPKAAADGICARQRSSARSCLPRHARRAPIRC